MVFERLRGYLERHEPEEAGLSAYGKLPQYGDFFRHRLSSRAALAFKGWLDHGFSRFWEGDEEYRRHRIGTHALLLSFPPADARIFGCLWGSHGAGLRSFPFALFLALPRARRAGITLPGLELLGEVTRHAVELRPRLEAASELEEVVSALGQIRIALGGVPEAESRRELEQCLAEVRLGQLAASFYGAEWQRPWADLIRYLRRRAEPGGAPLAVRLPTSDRLPLACQVGFWALFLEPILGRAGTAVQLLHPLDHGEDGIILLRRELRHEDVHAFHPEMPGYELIEDLRRTVPAGRRGPAEAAPADGSLTLDAVLARGLGAPDGA